MRRVVALLLAAGSITIVDQYYREQSKSAIRARRDFWHSAESSIAKSNWSAVAVRPASGADDWDRPLPSPPSSSISAAADWQNPIHIDGATADVMVEVNVVALDAPAVVHASEARAQALAARPTGAICGDRDRPAKELACLNLDAQVTRLKPRSKPAAVYIGSRKILLVAKALKGRFELLESIRNVSAMSAAENARLQVCRRSRNLREEEVAPEPTSSFVFRVLIADSKRTCSMMCFGRCRCWDLLGWRSGPI